MYVRHDVYGAFIYFPAAGKHHERRRGTSNWPSLVCMVYYEKPPQRQCSELAARAKERMYSYVFCWSIANI
jgi:hypothetical protein